MRTIIALTFPLILAGVLAVIVSSGQQPSVIIYELCLVSVCIYSWTIGSWRAVTGRWLDAYSLFATAAFLFNAGQSALYSFGAIDSLLNERFSQDSLITTLLTVNVYLMALHVGALIAHLLVQPKSQRRQLSPGDLALARVVAIRIGWTAIILALPSAVLQLEDTVGTVYNGGYFALYEDAAISAGSTSSLTMLAPLLIPAALFLLAGSRPQSVTSRVSCGLISVFVLLQFFLGFRGTAIVSAAATAWLWNKTIRRLRFSVIVASIALLSILLPLIGAVRDTPGAQRTNLSYLLEAYNRLDNPVVSIVSEMGGSMIVNAYVQQLIPEYRDFEYGKTYAYGLLTIVPNLFWPGVHPSAANSPSKWLIETVDPGAAARGGGIGFTFLAEAYINFGLVGGALCIALLGAIVAIGSLWAQHVNDPGRSALVAITLSVVLLYARAELGNIIRTVVWYGLFPFWIYLSMLRRQKSVRRGTTEGHGQIFVESLPAPSALVRREATR